MSAKEIDDYLAALEPAKRDALQALRERILKRLPVAEQCISYSMPGFRVDGKVLVGIAAFREHLSWFPHSGKVIPAVAKDPATTHLLDPYDWSHGTLRFGVDQVLPDELIDTLIAVKKKHTFGG